MLGTVTVRNLITGARLEVEVDPSLTVRQVVEHADFLPPGSSFEVRDKDGRVCSDDRSVDHEGAVLSVGLPGAVSGGGYPIWVAIAEGFVVLKMLGPFAEAFANKLGDSLGESVSAAVARMRLFKRQPANSSEQGQSAVRDGAVYTFIALPDDLTEEVRLALIDLDVTASGIRGRTVCWDPESKTWRPAVRLVSPSAMITVWVGNRDAKLLAVDPALTVRQVIENSGVAPRGRAFRVVYNNTSQFVDDYPSIYVAGTDVAILFT